MTDQNSAPPFPVPQKSPTQPPVQPTGSQQSVFESTNNVINQAAPASHIHQPTQTYPAVSDYPTDLGTQYNQLPGDALTPVDQPTSVGSRKEFDPEQPIMNPATTDQDLISIDREKPPIPAKPAEMISYTEVGAEQELDPELAEYMSRVEKDKLELNQPVVVHGQTVVEPANWHGQPSITLPTDKQTIITGLKASVSKNVRWLATWCMRMISKFQGRVIYSDAPHNPEHKPN